MNQIQRLLDIMQKLRDPESGCSWDVAQDFKSIAVYTIEEAYELADAIERNQLDDIRDELGDLLFQVVFHAQMASEQGSFDFDAVARSICEKMLRRHPHVFGDVKYANQADQDAAWHQIKMQEKHASAGNGKESIVADSSAMEKVDRGLPELVRARKLQKAAAKVGFDWPDCNGVLGKCDEEMAELKVAIASREQRAIAEEFGDLLFTMVNLARHLKLDPGASLRQANLKFETRFRTMEKQAGPNADLGDLTAPEMEKLWEQVKQTQKNSGS